MKGLKGLFLFVKSVVQLYGISIEKCHPVDFTYAGLRFRIRFQDSVSGLGFRLDVINKALLCLTFFEASAVAGCYGAALSILNASG